MTTSYYDLLGVPPDAPADEVKRAFRREIARYHPDKVQHLGREFQEIAAEKAAALTHAYKTLTDAFLRAEYDAQRAADSPAAVRPRELEPEVEESAWSRRWRPPARDAHSGGAGTQAGGRPAATDPGPASNDGSFTTERAGLTDLVRKAAMARFRHALDAQFGRCDESPVAGFDVACAPPKGRFWSKVPPRILSRVVAQVDAASLVESWTMAARTLRRDDQRDVCVFLMGPAVAPAGELGRAIAEQRRKPTPGGKLFVIPVNTRTWAAHIPNDAPEVVKSLVGRLKSG